MVFSSLPFLFGYLPLTLLVYFLSPLRWRNFVLLVVSLLFYGWGEPVYIVIMFLSIIIDYTHGLLVEKFRSDDKKARWFVAQSVIFNLALLGFFKYWDFIAANLSLIPGIDLPQLGIPLPIGISFYTFQTMSYTIDVYRKDAPVQRNMVDFGAFVTMFPQLIAGPIVQYKTVAADLRHRLHTSENFALGARRFCVGLAKKVLLANSIGALWEDCLAAQGAGTLTVLGGYLQYTHSIRLAADGTYHVGQSTYGDLSLHLAVCTSIVNASFPLENSLMLGATMAYPYLSDSIATSMLMLGMPLNTAMVFTGTMMMALVYAGYGLLAMQLCRRRGAAALAFFLLFLNGGLGFFYTLDATVNGYEVTTMWDNLANVMQGYYQTPTNQPDPHNLRWVNIICDMLVPQRGILGGWTLLMPALNLLVPPLCRREHHGVRELVLLGLFLVTKNLRVVLYGGLLTAVFLVWGGIFLLFSFKKCRMMW